MNGSYHIYPPNYLTFNANSSSATEGPLKRAASFQETSTAVANFTQTATRFPSLVVVNVQPAWAYDLAMRAERIKSLRRGWDGTKSVPVSKTVVELAQKLIKDALTSTDTASAPYLSPGGDGSLQIEWHTKTGEIELDISADGDATVWIRSRVSDEEFEGENERALSLFARWAPWIAKASDNESDVLGTSNTSIYGSGTQLSFYKDDTVS